MADSKTLAEWQLVLADAIAQQAAAKQAYTDAYNAQWQADIAFKEAAIANGKVQATSIFPVLGPERDAYNAAKTALAAADAAKWTAATNVDNIAAVVTQATSSVAAAETAPTNTIATPAPASDPGVVVTPVRDAYATLSETTDPNKDHGSPYDDDGNLMPGWALDADEAPYWIGGNYVDPATVASAKASYAAATTDPNQDHGLPYDDDGNLMPGWSLTEDNDPVWVGGGFVEPATIASAQASYNTAKGITKSLAPVTVTAKKSPFTADDWRIRLSLADSANYLYKIAGKSDILYPLIATNGVVFPYTPSINTAYRANYDPAEITHSNYKLYFYKNSSVDDISITADFTAQDTAEANYMLAVIHFFKSATKMFYGQDEAPRAGTPPPLLYLTGYGPHQFEHHPLLLTNFTYSLPNDVDYIRAGSNAQWSGVNLPSLTSRLASSGLQVGGAAKPPAFAGIASKDNVTYVPTKIQLTIGLLPVVTRNDISKNFSLKDYAAGTLSGKTSGGIW